MTYSTTEEYILLKWFERRSLIWYDMDEKNDRWDRNKEGVYYVWEILLEEESGYDDRRKHSPRVNTSKRKEHDGRKIKPNQQQKENNKLIWGGNSRAATGCYFFFSFSIFIFLGKKKK